jgi:microcystin degradation protein MlrC
MDAALDEALAYSGGPVVLADVSDNAGGGAPNDSTFLLRAMLERGVSNAAIGCIWDPIATSLAIEAGEGAEFDLRFGGKMGPMSGQPVDAQVRVGKICRKATQRFSQETGKLGDAVALHLANAIDVVAISHRTQTFSPEVFTNVGIDPALKKILVVKSMQHFYAGFAPIAAQILYVAAPGALVPDFTQIPYQRARRDVWPLA